MSISAADIAQYRESTISHSAPLLPPTPSDAEKTNNAIVTAKSLSDDTSGVHDDDDIDLPELHRVEPLNITVFHEILFVGVVIMAQFLTLAGLGQSIAPMAIIAETLSVSNNPGEQAWFAAAYSLTVGTFILISGQIGDILGHKRVFIFGFFFLGTWSAFAGFSAYTHRPIFFDICRGFQGIGAALLAPNALALLGRAYPPGIKKNIVFSLFGAMAPWGFVVGSLFASLFAEYAWWPWAFYSYGMAAWALAAFALLVIPKSLAHDAQLGGRQKKVHFDYTGSLFGVVGLVLVNIAFNNGPLYGWGQSHVYLTLIFGLISLAVFGAVEIRALSPLLPVKALTSTVTYTMALVGIGWGSFGIWIYYSIRFLLELRGESPLVVSIEYIPAMICGLLAAGVTGFMLTHTPVAFTMMMAMVAFFLGQLITSTQPVAQTYWAQMFVAILIMPFGKFHIPPSNFLFFFVPSISSAPPSPQN
jgi:MFS family permease